MTIFDRLVLLLTGLVAIYAIWYFIKRQKDASTAAPFNLYAIVSFAVLLVAGLLLIIFGWDALGNKFVAVVAGLIPFSLATALVSKYHPDFEKKYLGLMIIGLIAITVGKYMELTTFSKIVYPVFHATAGLTIFFIPIFAVKAGKAKTPLIYVTVGGTLIGLGGIALAFLTAGKQLLFFSQEFVLLILAPLLFLTALFFILGLVKEGEA